MLPQMTTKFQSHSVSVWIWHGWEPLLSSKDRKIISVQDVHMRKAAEAHKNQREPRNPQQQQNEEISPYTAGAFQSSIIQEKL